MKSSERSVIVTRTLIVLAAAVVLFGLISYYKRVNSSSASSSPSTSVPERFNTSLQPAAGPAIVTPVASSPSSSAATYAPVGVEPAGNEYLLPAGAGSGSSKFKDPFPQDRTSPEDLLPRDAANSKWSQVNPAGQGELRDVNLLSAGYHIGTNTQGQSLRNASHDLRSEPNNPRYKVSIFNNSTIESDLSRRPLE